MSWPRLFFNTESRYSPYCLIWRVTTPHIVKGSHCGRLRVIFKNFEGLPLPLKRQWRKMNYALTVEHCIPRTFSRVKNHFRVDSKHLFMNLNKTQALKSTLLVVDLEPTPSRLESFMNLTSENSLKEKGNRNLHKDKLGQTHFCTLHTFQLFGRPTNYQRAKTLSNCKKVQLLALWCSIRPRMSIILHDDGKVSEFPRSSLYFLILWLFS